MQADTPSNSHHYCSCDWAVDETQVADRQGGDLEDSQRRVQALEAELEAKAREGSALLADTLALKVR